MAVHAQDNILSVCLPKNDIRQRMRAAPLAPHLLISTGPAKIMAWIGIRWTQKARVENGRVAMRQTHTKPGTYPNSSHPPPLPQRDRNNLRYRLCVIIKYSFKNFCGRGKRKKLTSFLLNNSMSKTEKEESFSAGNPKMYIIQYTIHVRKRVCTNTYSMAIIMWIAIRWNGLYFIDVWNTGTKQQDIIWQDLFDKINGLHCTEVDTVV